MAPEPIVHRSTLGKSFLSTDGDKNPIPPQSGIFPLLREIEPGTLVVSGTGFYVTRYGLFLSAYHVLAEALENGQAIYALHVVDGVAQAHMRRAIRFSSLQQSDMALGELDNFVEKYPDDSLMNRRATLTTIRPAAGNYAATFAYPENARLDFRSGAPPSIRGDYFDGAILRLVGVDERPFLRRPHFETSIRIRGGASGGPVFDDLGRVFGVNSRGWDFDGSEEQGNELSSIIPIDEAFELGLANLRIPRNSWEWEQIPVSRMGKHLTVRQLANYGHVLVEARSP